jgi:radical SAM-linked protein
VNRLRIRFTRGTEIKFISHLDVIRVWHRALRRAGVTLAYSEGFNPHPKLSLAAPLALGVTGEAELMDVYLVQPMSPHAFTSLMQPCLPQGLEIAQVFNVGLTLPSLQSQLRFAEYTVRVPAADEDTLRLAIIMLMRKETLPWQHQRDTGVKIYDLRRLIDNIKILGYDCGIATISMILRCDGEGAGRSEQVTRALGLDTPLDIHRNRLILQTS